MNKNKKRERFLRLAPYRTNQVLRKIKTLGNCSNRSAYEYKRDEINKIFSAIEKELRETKSKFRYPHKKNEFKLE